MKTFEELTHEQYHGVKVIDAFPTESIDNNILKSNFAFANNLSMIH